MDVKAPSPQTTLLILLGASEWPFAPEFQGSEAFAKAAQRLRAYFLNPRPFGLPPENLLDLFNSDQSADELDVAISQFLGQRVAALRVAGHPARDLLLYFVGHGGFVGRDSDFYLAIRRTRMDNPRASGLQMMSLADTLTERARHLRRIIILDCCFAAAAFSAFQSGPAQVAMEKTIDAFEVRQKAVGVPTKGTTLLCSSNHKSPSLLLPDGSSTMFTKAFLDALIQGTPSPRDHLTLRDVKEAATDLLAEIRNAPKPVIHSPDQSEGDIADIPFFPNPKIEKERRQRAEEERIRQAEEERRRIEEERVRWAEEQARKIAEEEQARQAEKRRRHQAEEEPLRKTEEPFVATTSSPPPPSSATVARPTTTVPPASLKDDKGSAKKINTWGLDKHRLVAMVVGVLLYTVITYIPLHTIDLYEFSRPIGDNPYLPSPYGTLVGCALTIPFFLGTKFGPWTGLATASLGIIFNDLLLSRADFSNSWYFYIYIIWGLFGFIPGLAFILTKGRPNTWHPVTTVICLNASAILVGSLLLHTYYHYAYLSSFSSCCAIDIGFYGHFYYFYHLFGTYSYGFYYGYFSSSNYNYAATFFISFSPLILSFLFTFILPPILFILSERITKRQARIS